MNEILDHLIASIAIFGLLVLIANFFLPPICFVLALFYHLALAVKDLVLWRRY